MEPAGFQIRFIAYLIDAVLLGIATSFLHLIAGEPTEVSFEGMLDLILNLLYFTVAISVWSATIGKHLLGLCVLRPDGSRVGPGRALARYFAHLLSALLLFVGFIMIGLRQDKRGLHDLICDTVVVRR